MKSAPSGDDVRCPVCGIGRLRDLVFDEGAPGRPREQQSDSREVQIFSCGHEVTAGSLDTADASRLDVERRGSEETVDPSQS